jgi:drug/metabolite transporter (DMT)-like permease
MFSLLSGHWLALTLIAVFLFGLGDGLYKQFVEHISPSRFCLYSAPVAAVVYISFFLTHDHPPPLALEGRQFLYCATLANLLEGIAVILYFESLKGGLVSIVGPITAASPAVTVVLAYFFLEEILTPVQYGGVVLVIAGCLGIAYEPSDSPADSPFPRSGRAGPDGEPPGKSDPGKKAMKQLWFLQAVLSVFGWGIGATLMKYAYQLPNANEANFMFFRVFTVALTLGVYGLLREREWHFPAREAALAAVPLAMYSVGNAVLITAYKWGPASLVMPLLAASIPVTLVYAFFVLRERLTRFQWACITLAFIGMLLCSTPE